MHPTELKMNEVQKIQVKLPEIKFFEYEQLKEEATELAKWLKTLELTEETMASSKKLMASVNKSVKKLEDERIRIKKYILTPYDVFEKEIKEIVSIVKEADLTMRSQVRELEEKEREEKANLIEDIWNKRITAYDFGDIFKFSDFIKPEYLNKSTAVNKVEKEMVRWLEGIEKDLNAIKSIGSAEELLQIYVEIKDLATALEVFDKRKRQREKIEKYTNKREEIETSNEEYFIKVFSKKDLKLLEMLMNENQIKYERIEE